MSTTPLKILVVDDCPLLREALSRILAGVACGASLLEADCVPDALERIATETDLDLVVVDIDVRDAGGPDAVARLTRAREAVPVLVYSARDDAVAAHAVLAAGARGMISKRAPTPLLEQVIRLVLAGGTYVPPNAFHDARGTEARTALVASAPTAAEALKLTARQLDVLALLLQGQPNKRICRTLDMREGTVKTHINAIFRTLGVRNRTEVGYALSRRGLRLPAITERPAGIAAAPGACRAPRPAVRAPWPHATNGRLALAILD